MIYKRDKVTSRGEAAIVRYRKYWLIGGIISLAIFVIAIIEFFCIDAMKESMSIFQFFSAELAFLVFGVFAIIYSRVKKYTPLLEGCKDIYRAIKRAVNKYNRTNASIAKKTAKSTGRTVTYSQCSTDFRYEDLYELLQKSDTVNYIGYPTAVVSSLKVGNKSTTRQDDNHNFDDELTDEEFFDLLD